MSVGVVFLGGGGDSCSEFTVPIMKMPLLCGRAASSSGDKLPLDRDETFPPTRY